MEEGGAFHGGVALFMGGLVLFMGGGWLWSLLGWRPAGGWHPWGGGQLNQRSCCSQNHWSSNDVTCQWCHMPFWTTMVVSLARKFMARKHSQSRYSQTYFCFLQRWIWICQQCFSILCGCQRRLRIERRSYNMAAERFDVCHRWEQNVQHRPVCNRQVGTEGLGDIIGSGQNWKMDQQ